MLLTLTRNLRVLAPGLVLLAATGCPPDQPSTSDTPTTGTGTTEPVTTTSPTGPGETEPLPGTTSSTTDPVAETSGTTTGTTDASGTTVDDTGDDTGTIPVPMACEVPEPACTEAVTNCKTDIDHDGFPFTCDNAPDHTNPNQADLDGDGFGDIVDLCPTIVTESNTADTDRDGVGNECDTCPRHLSIYNENADALPFYLRVRNVPQQTDSDRDGIGDACDNCVRVPNCQGFGDADGLAPFVVGAAIDTAAADCQADADADMIGDACAGATLPGAAGPVGFGDADDFDQDGLTNSNDACPRLPVAPRACDADDDCPGGAACTAAGACNHADHDGDGVGDLCDTCVDDPNPKQIQAGGDFEDDPDGDFIGTACEQHFECFERANPRRHGFFNVSVGGRCCTTVYDGAPLLDPNGDPLDIAEFGPRPAGVFELPAGCAEALAQSEDGEAHPIGGCNVDAPGQLYDFFCLLPTWDSEYDGVPDRCDLCRHAHDPGQEIYVDMNGKEWPNYGKWCRGEYAPELFDPANMCLPPAVP